MGGDKELVFVYGTLRKGASNHWRMEGAELLGPGVVPGALYRIGWYPGLVRDDRGGEVRGEVYCVSGAKLAKLDGFEGCGEGDPGPHEYRRVRMAATVAGEAREVWVWEFIAEIGERAPIASGDWLER